MDEFYLREDRGVDSSLNDSSINSKDGENDAGQEDQRQFIHIFDSNKHHQSHQAQHNGAIHPHVVEESRLCLCPLQALQLEDGRLRNDINLKGWKEEETKVEAEEVERDAYRRCR